MRTDKYIKTLYERRANYEEKYNRLLIPKILEVLEGIKADKVLGVGCGGGDITEIIAKKVVAKKVVGVDISLKQLKRAREKGIETIQVDLNREEIPLKEKFDLIICTDALEHMINPDHVLDEIHRLSKSKQFFLVPNLASWFNRVVLLMGWQPFGVDTSIEFKGYNPFFHCKQPYGHIRSFTKDSMKELLERHDFNVLKIEGAMLNQDNLLRDFVDKIFSLTTGLKSRLIFLTELK